MPNLHIPRDRAAAARCTTSARGGSFAHSAAATEPRCAGGTSGHSLAAAARRRAAAECFTNDLHAADGRASRQTSRRERATQQAARAIRRRSVAAYPFTSATQNRRARWSRAIDC